MGRRPLCVLTVVYRLWASAWSAHPCPYCVFSAGGGRSSVEALYTLALDIEEFLSGVVDSVVRVFVADVVKSYDTVDFFTVFLVACVCLLGSGRHFWVPCSC